MEIRVLVASGYSIDEKVNEILGHRGSDFIQKPFALLELSSKVRSLLEAAE